MRSLEGRLQLGLALSLILLMGLVWLVGNQAIRAMTESFVASRLEHDAQGLLSSMLIEPQGVKLRWRRVSEVYSQPFSGHYYEVSFEDGYKVRSRSLWDQVLDIPLLKAGDSRRQLVDGPSGQRLLLLLQGFEKGGRNFTIGVAEDMTPVYLERDSFMRWFALLALGGLVGLLVVQSLVVRRSFKRLNKVRDDIHRLEQGRTQSLSEDVPAEVLPLVREFNHLLQLLTQRLERSRNALGNLAHALKGPLNLLTQYFDASDATEQGADRHQAALHTERIRQLMQRELKRARLAGRNLSAARFNAADELPDLIAVLQQVYREREVSVDYQLERELEPFGDREDMLELLGNLLDNGCKWAATRVICRIGGHQEIRIQVEDDGAGLLDEDIQGLTRRGTRLDENVEGHGLGLAIVGDIVKLYGGSIQFSRSASLGGLCVTLLLPRSGAVSSTET